MEDTAWYQRYATNTRGQIVALLRRGANTVDELAQALELTDNAVRAHLAVLERDGLVQQQGVRRSGGSGKPAYTYGLTAQANQILFARGYIPLLKALLEALPTQLPPTELELVIQRVAQNFVAAWQDMRRQETGDEPGDSDDGGEDAVRYRIKRALTLLSELGGLPQQQERDGNLVISSTSCPLAAVVSGHPLACRLIAAIVSEITGAPVAEQCQREPQAQCMFSF